MKKTLIQNASIVNEGFIKQANVLIQDTLIHSIIPVNEIPEADEIIDATGFHLFPGVIDDQVHFREPGLTHKGDIFSESFAAVAGGITSYMDMPNTIPQTLTIELLEEKHAIAAEKSWANYSFYLGGSNNNLDELKKLRPGQACGIKLFLGASTGNMLVNDPQILEKIFSEVKSLIAIHSEDDNIIKRNLQYFKQQYGDDIPASLHPEIRSREACFASTQMAVNLAKKHNTRLHILHLSTAEELELLENRTFHKNKKITAEVCVHHLWFNQQDYQEKGNLIKWNPAIKSETDRKSLLEAVKSGKIDIVATDHAPHTLEEKLQSYVDAPSGGPLVQHSLLMMCELFHKKELSLELIVEKMCHIPARLFSIYKRGFIREGYFADLVLLDLHRPQKVEKSNILYHCGWSPLEGKTLQSSVIATFVNGNMVYSVDKTHDFIPGNRLVFENIA